MMTKKLKWRLSKLPTVDEITLLVEKKILKEEEAREILFSSETEEDIGKDELKSEIKFLREMVEKLSKDRNQIITVIKEIETPKYNWYKPYEVWCSSGSHYTDASVSAIGISVGSVGNSIGITTSSKACSNADYNNQLQWAEDSEIIPPFTSIKTF